MGTLGSIHAVFVAGSMCRIWESGEVSRIAFPLGDWRVELVVPWEIRKGVRVAAKERIAEEMLVTWVVWRVVSGEGGGPDDDGEVVKKSRRYASGWWEVERRRRMSTPRGRRGIVYIVDIAICLIFPPSISIGD